MLSFGELQKILKRYAFILSQRVQFRILIEGNQVSTKSKIRVLNQLASEIGSFTSKNKGIRFFEGFCRFWKDWLDYS